MLWTYFLYHIFFLKKHVKEKETKQFVDKELLASLYLLKLDKKYESYV